MIAVHRPVAGFINMGHAHLNHDTFDGLPEIGMPVLLPCGAEDMITPAQHIREMARRVPNAEMHITPNTMHGAMSAKPATFALVIDSLRRY